jgi:hypothetical protein
LYYLLKTMAEKKVLFYAAGRLTRGTPFKLPYFNPGLLGKEMS